MSTVKAGFERGFVSRQRRPPDLDYLRHIGRLGKPDVHPMGREASDRLEEALALRPGDRVLEVGCGTGQTMLCLAVSHPVRIDGLDCRPEMLAVARCRLALAGLRGRTWLMQADGTVGIPCADGSYDHVYAESVLGFQSAADADQFLAEISRVLRPGGRFVANEAALGSAERSITRVRTGAGRLFLE